MRDAPAGEWTLFSTEVTDKSGRITYKIPDERAFSYGLYPVKMIVRWAMNIHFCQGLLSKIFAVLSSREIFLVSEEIIRR